MWQFLPYISNTLHSFWLSQLQCYNLANKFTLETELQEDGSSIVGGQTYLDNKTCVRVLIGEHLSTPLFSKNQSLPSRMFTCGSASVSTRHLDISLRDIQF